MAEGVPSFVPAGEVVIGMESELELMTFSLFRRKE